MELLWHQSLLEGQVEHIPYTSYICYLRLRDTCEAKAEGRRSPTEAVQCEECEADGGKLQRAASADRGSDNVSLGNKQFLKRQS